MSGIDVAFRDFAKLKRRIEASFVTGNTTNSTTINTNITSTSGFTTSAIATTTSTSITKTSESTRQILTMRKPAQFQFSPWEIFLLQQLPIKATLVTRLPKPPPSVTRVLEYRHGSSSCVALTTPSPAAFLLTRKETKAFFPRIFRHKPGETDKTFMQRKKGRWRKEEEEKEEEKKKKKQQN
ncbi:hypothetical protein E2C01_019743 [Portunus trituberculatus]|uniref:Uncharacterized protein n=1 Tax=Portunus trituberculatus TaxID=210409 RepID=A0A5B7DZP6_PORTR|nr:hypothetical protein [Portunus trituberculatus]